MSFIEKAKEFVSHHPYETAAGVFGVGVVLIFVLRKPAATNTSSAAGDASAYYAANAANVNSGNQLAAVQSQSQAQVAAASDQLQANQDAISGQVSIAQIQAATSTNANDDALKATLAQVQAQLTEQTTASTLSAQVQQSQINDALTASENNNATSINAAQINTAGLLGAEAIASHYDATVSGGGVTVTPPAPTVAPAPANLSFSNDPTQEGIILDYQNYLGRDPSQSEVNYYVGAVSQGITPGGTVGNVSVAQALAPDFTNSPEYLASHNTSLTTGHGTGG